MKLFRSTKTLPSKEGPPNQLVRIFQSETAEIVEAPEPTGVRATVYVLGLFIFTLIILSLVTRLDRVVNGTGQIVSTQATAVVQALDTSLIKTIDVRDGQKLKAGDTLATLDPTFVTADVSALKTQIASLDALIGRSEAELANKPYVPAATSDEAATRYGQLQQSYYQQRHAQLTEQLRAYNEQIAQVTATIGKLQNDKNRYTDRAKLAKEVEDMRATLAAAQVGSRLNLLAATDQKTELLRNVEFQINALNEAQHQLEAAVSTRDAFKQQWLGQASQELVQARNQRDAALQQLEKAAKRKELVKLVASEDSVVLRMAKLSVGSVLKEGDPLLYLAPLRSPVEAEVRVSTRDIGFIRAGDPVKVRLDAFNSVEHGIVEGTVRWISEGAFTTNEDSATAAEPYYKARIELTNVDLRNVPEGFRLIPGMTLGADIHIGTRSLMMYFVNGALKGMSEAMREP